jgi:hypothetical protein
MQTKAAGAKRGEPVTQEDWRQNEKPEKKAEEGNLEGMHLAG